jgi:polyhydroxyalkanoate synthesis regulator phasin
MPNPKHSDKSAEPGRAAARPKAAPKGRASKPAPEVPGQAPSRAVAEDTPAPASASAAARDEALRANLAALRDLLAGGVVLTAQRLQEAVDEAVTRGRMTRRDAEALASGLLSAGREQTAEVIADVEHLLGRGRSDLESARSITRDAVKGSSDLVLREVDKARRAAGLARALPIAGYDELTPAQIEPYLKDLTPAELRKLRTYERRHADRAPVLAALEAALG